MNNRLICSIAALALSLTAIAQPYQGAPKFHGAFKEDFSGKSSEFFNYNYRRNADDFRYFSGHPSLSEPGTSIMMYRIDPADPAGAGKGPEIISKDYTFYGSYSARIKVPKAKDVQPNVGAVVGYFTYNIDPEIGQSEIDIEELELEMIDYGVEELYEQIEVDKDDNETKVIVIYGEYTAYGQIQKYIEENSYELISGGFEQIPNVDLKDATEEQRATLDKLTNMLLDDEDVTNVYTTLKPAEE